MMSTNPSSVPPAFSAKATAASFPDATIIPLISWSTFTLSLGSK